MAALGDGVRCVSVCLCVCVCVCVMCASFFRSHHDRYTHNTAQKDVIFCGDFFGFFLFENFKMMVPFYKIKIMK